MKKRLSLIGLLALLCLCSLALFSHLFSAATVGREAKSALSYEGLSVRYEGEAALRAVFSVNRDDIAKLEEDFDVCYGVIAAIGEKDGAVSQKAEDLKASKNKDGGISATNKGALAFTVYKTGEAPAAWAFLDEETFALTLNIADHNLGTEYCFSAFLAATDRSTGKTTFVYDPAAGALFGSVSSKNGAGTSFGEVANYLLTEYAADTLTAFRYYHSETLRRAYEGYLPERTFPVAVPGESPYFDAAPERLIAYFGKAREAYADPEAPSLIPDYRKDQNLDHASEIYLAWEGDRDAEYRVTLTSEAFPRGEYSFTVTGCTAKLYNLFPGYVYVWNVVRADTGAETVVDEWFEIGEGPRYITAEGARNVRDAGGWNGITAGILYRGSELNPAENHGLGLTEEGLLVMRALGIRTELDLRHPSAAGGQTESALGGETGFLQMPIGSYSPLKNANSYASILRILCRWENYPVYVHCWGGADRTGTVIFLAQGIAGVSLGDLAVDYELTSFAPFGVRNKDDEETFPYAPMVADILSLEGGTVEEKFLTYAREYMGLTVAEISNLRSILRGTGAVFAAASLWGVSNAKEGFSLDITLRESAALTSLTLNGEALPFTFSDGTLTVTAESLAALGAEGLLTLTFDDGTVLRTELTK